MWLPPAASLAQDISCPLLGPSLGTRVSAQAGGYGCCFPLCRFNVNQCGAHIPEIFTDRQDTDTTGHTGCPHRGLPSTALEWPAQDSSKAQTQCFLPAAGVDAHPPLSRLTNLWIPQVLAWPLCQPSTQPRPQTLTHYTGHLLTDCPSWMHAAHTALTNLSLMHTISASPPRCNSTDLLSPDVQAQTQGPCYPPAGPA